MKTIPHYSAFERISSTMAKEFGTIKKGTEDDYLMLLLPIEGNLLKMSRKTRNKNGRRAMEAIRIALFTIYGYLNSWVYDFGSYLTPENKDFVYAALMAVDPFTNEAIRQMLENEYDWDSPADLRRFFKDPVKCLLRIGESIQLWTDEGGTDGYFKFLEKYVSGIVSTNNDQMDCAVKVPGIIDYKIY